MEKGLPKRTLRGGTLDLGSRTMPQLPRHSGDRNRTSPFAFTGNKFEFRAVGSTHSVAWPNTVLNTIVAHQLRAFKKTVDALIDKGVKKDEAVLRVIRDLIVESKAIRFEGNGYGEEWRKEAAKPPHHRYEPVDYACLLMKIEWNQLKDNAIANPRAKRDH